MTIQTEINDKILQTKISSTLIVITDTALHINKIHHELKEYKNTKYVITVRDGTSVQIYIAFTTQIRISAIDKIVRQQDGIGNSSIKYDRVRNSTKCIEDLKEQEYLEHGEIPPVGKIRTENEIATEAIALAEQGDTDSALQIFKDEKPMTWLTTRNQLTTNLKSINTKRKKHIAPVFAEFKLKPKQEEIYTNITGTPVNRRIHLIKGRPGSGKTTLVNYAVDKQQKEYGVYMAPQSASYDKVMTRYDEEGLTIFDLPMNYDIDTFGAPLASIIETFSDFGKTVTSTFKNTKTQQILCNIAVFSNDRVIDALAKLLSHRDVVIHTLDDEGTLPEPMIVEPVLFSDIAYNKEAPALVEPDSSDDEEEFITVTATNKPHIKIVSKKNKKGFTSSVYKYLVQLRNPHGQIVTKPLDTYNEALEYCPEGYTYP